MPRRGGSGHYFSMSGHQEALHGYCVCCSNYRRLQSYFDGQYYCSSCRRKLTAGLRKAKLLPEQTTTEQEAAARLATIEEMATKIQASLANEIKTTKWSPKGKWSPKRRR
jgi:hypothetical protein